MPHTAGSVPAPPKETSPRGMRRAGDAFSLLKLGQALVAGFGKPREVVKPEVAHG
ncbi:hypothetical protein [Pseudorhodoferax sp.]|uniref:hypothetical protein n=1 Tax=Pseudorhodoferax sp. TaxID=1993553 RepID=UPI0039E6C7C7